MRSALRKLRRPRSASTLAALLLVLVLVVGIGLWGYGGEVQSGGIGFGSDAVSAAAVDSLALGSRRDDVEDELGRGLDALEYQETGAALEPLDEECRYYAQEGTGNVRDIVQLCYRDDRLVRKRSYAATPGARLMG